MTAQADSQAGPARFSRPRPKLEGPNRGFGGYYRSSDHKVAGKVFRGVPLQTAEDTAVAAVRMGYRVIDAQIDRVLAALALHRAVGLLQPEDFAR